MAVANVLSTATAPLPSGSRFGGRYCSERLLGRGGMGEVHAVLDESSGRRLALKYLSADAGERQELAFRREYQTLALLKHPHIVEVYDYVVEASGSAFYTMELLEGSDLSTRAPLPWREVCRVVRDVASIVGLLHARRLLHRDLSPRNIWCLPDGRIKLIDFGALTSFGAAHDVVGTPPFVPPEALRERNLDQRSDLFALGALAYWLISGSHAFPARSFAELPAAWMSTPGVLSRLLLRLGREETPAELDALVETLLQDDPKLRPQSAEGLIDQLNAIAGLTPEASPREGLDLLQNPLLVARGQEHARMVLSLRRAERSQGRALLVEAAAGLGRTRLLHELAVSAQLSGVTALSASAASGVTPFAVANALALRLLEALPGVARKAAAPYRTELAALSDELCTRLGATRTEQSAAGTAPFEQRMRLSSALTEWFLGVCESRTLALFVDDVQRVDQESQAFLIALAHQAKNRRLLLVTSLPAEDGDALSMPLQTLLKLSKRVQLKPLNQSELGALLGSIFGNASYLSRLSERLYRTCAGNPAHCLLLLEQLVQSGAIDYREGMWVLPQALPPAVLSLDWQGARRARVARLSPAARSLLQQLSVARGAVPRELCLDWLGAASDSAPQLLELIQSGFLIEADNSVSFAQPALREELEAALPNEERSRCHRALGELLLARTSDPLELLRAGVHLLRGGDRKRSLRILTDAALHFGAHDPTFMPAAAPLMEEALNLLRARAAGMHQTMALEGALAVAGYYHDRRFAHYGDAALHALTRALHLHWARALSPLLGKKLALYLALGTAALSLHVRAKRCATPSFQGTILLLFFCASALAGAGAVCIDAAASQRAADAIAPLAALGDDHIAGFVYQFCSALAAQSRGHLWRSSRDWEGILARLDQPTLPHGMPEGMVIHYRAGALLAYGVKATWCDGDEALRIADRLEQLGLKLYEMSADQLRAGYYANQGKFALYEQYKQRLDLHALQRGSTWQVETWAPSTLLTAAHRTDDAMLIKRALFDTSRISQHVESLKPYLKRGRGTYYAITRRYQDALKYIDDDEAPQSYVAWARMRGTFARVLNGMKQHDKARAVCLHALAQMDAEDARYVALNLTVCLELALAEAQLGQHVEAAARVDALIAKLAPTAGDLTLFSLHEARAQVALIAGAYEQAERHARVAQHHARTLELPTLLTRSAKLLKRLDRSTDRDGEAGALHSHEALLTQCLQKLLRDDSHTASLSTRADIALSVALELSGADRGLVVANLGAGATVLAGSDALPDDLMPWVEERMTHEADAALSTATDVSDVPIDPNLLQLEGAHYRMLPLWVRHGSEHVLVGALALGLPRGAPTPPPLEALQVMGARLAEVLQAEAREQAATVS